MTKDKINKNNLDDINDLDFDEIDIKELDKKMEEFYIDREKISNIKVPDDMMFLAKKSIDKAQNDMKKERLKKISTSVVASITIILSIGAYNPVLAHKIPYIEKLLQNINNVLHIDEIARITEIDKILPKAKIDKKGKIKFEVRKEELAQPNLSDKDEKVHNQDAIYEPKEDEKYIEVHEDSVNIPVTDEETINLIHEMANGIIVARDYSRGYTEISSKTIDAALKGVENMSDESSKNYLHNELKKWEAGNFDNGVELHNYVWRKLNGEVGEAIGLHYGEIENIKNSHFR
ncbi:DUF6241 domain-containing protein [Clostridium sp. CCUG 7971]|uniref:DUF6241 domain-containing protein n=1 Tax=Clostridium sp. CCUG 7971 TaxID=2811414 RepID=UPI001ABAC404|nr:DUF6241 domain-containing protein [Clostridium sp. CCUG 7971]MBO3443521.1 hypothetical protein [Clostridium sp. CCUG 7971]